MKGPLSEFPIVKTKIPNFTDKFDLSDLDQRKEYFRAKAGLEIDKLKEYLENNTFIAYLLGKKNSGKGTYTKLMIEIFGEDKIAHISVGDMVRAVYNDINDVDKREEMTKYLKENYRGYISIEDSINALIGKSQKFLLPTEFILALLKREIDKLDKKAIFIDGFPRDLDQVQYSLYFKDLANYRLDPDIFVAIDIPESVIDERMRNRVVCPKCHSPRNLKTLRTKEIGYDENTKEYFLMCDNPECNKERMVGKEGDSAGIESIRDRLILDDQLIKKVMSLYGIPKILLRNAGPMDGIEDNVDDYEVTPKYVYHYNEENKKVDVVEEPWVAKDDNGVESYSLLAPPVTVSLIKQLIRALEL